MSGKSRSGRPLNRIVWLVFVFVAITTFAVVAADLRTQILDAVRAYVSGEAQWSKAQKEAVSHLGRFAADRDERTFDLYRNAIAVPLGDHRARLEMEKPEPDDEIARDGFLQGRNHPDDIPGMIALFRYFRRVSFMRDAIEFWTEGDRLLAELESRADALHEEIRSAHPDEDAIAALLGEITRIDEALRPLEDGFSKTLGEGARRASLRLRLAVYGAAGLLLLIGVLLSRRILRAERRERDSAALTRAIVDEAPDGIITTDRDGRIVDFNPGAVRAFGWTRAEVLGRTIPDLLIPEEARERIHQLFLGVARQDPGPEGKQCLEITTRRKDGREVPVEIVVTAIEHGRSSLLAAHVRDLTERKRAEQAHRESQARQRAEDELREARAFFERVADATPLLFYIADLRERRLLYVNRRFATTLGYRVEDVENAPLEDLWARLHPDDLPQIPTLLTTAEEWPDDQAIEIEFRVRGTENDWRWLYTRNIVFSRDEQGRPVQVLGTAQDLTDRKIAEERARRHDEALAHVQRVATLGELVTSLAHELNQPLAAVVSFAQGCLRRLQSGSARAEEIHPAIEQIVSEAMRAGSFIRHLRALASKRPLPSETFDVNDLIRDLVRLVGPEARRFGVSIDTDLDLELPNSLGHRIQIEQVILNLLRNGLDAMREAPGPSGRLSIRTQGLASGGVAIEVADEGPGLLPEVQAHLFEAFFTTKSDGMGMGLAISRSLVEAHGGKIRARSQIGGGATFRVELPSPADVPDLRPFVLPHEPPPPGTSAEEASR